MKWSFILLGWVVGYIGWTLSPHGLGLGTPFIVAAVYLIWWKGVFSK